MLQNETTKSSGNKPLWWVPITYFSKSKQVDDKSPVRTKPAKWMEAKRSLTLKPEELKANRSDWVIFNIDQTGTRKVAMMDKIIISFDSSF